MSLKHARARIARGFPVVLTVLVLTTLLAGGAAAQEAAPGNGDPVTIDLNEVQESGISGEAALSSDGDQTSVDMRLEGEVRGNHPTHIHTGTCFNFDPNPLYPLETVILEPVDNSGTSESTVDVSMEELESSDYVILVHFSPERLTDYLVCGELPRAAATGGQEESTPALSDSEDEASTEEPDHMQHSDADGAADSEPRRGRLTTLPIAGSGPSTDRADSDALPIGLVTLAGLIVISAVSRRRTQGHSSV